MLVMLVACGYPSLPRLSVDDVLASDDGGSMDTLVDASPYLPHCANLEPTCGPAGATNCCASSVVPGNAAGATLAGTSFFRNYDAASDGVYTSMASPATVSNFRLDNYEVTVGRFRQFVNAGYGTQARAPTAGAGAHPFLPTSGWDPSWNGFLAQDAAQLQTAMKCDSAHQTWTDTPGSNESLPINCISWFEAMAFCIWDGGYLPTEAEFNYAASGGGEHRAYPWSPSATPGATTIDCSYANYTPQPAGCVNGTNRVGSESPKGDNRWGQSDLGGNVYEWNRVRIFGDARNLIDSAKFASESLSGSNASG